MHQTKDKENEANMDTWGILIFIIGIVLYFITKRKAFWLFVAGVGAGIVVGAIWAATIINQALR